MFDTDGSFTYTPPANFPGYDYAKYTASDSLHDQTAATANVLSQPGAVIWKFFEQVLHRDPAPTDLAFFIPLLAEYGSGVLSADFFESDELLNQVITGYYQQFLGRPPSDNDLTFWENVWHQTGGPEGIKAEFAQSPEFNALAGNANGTNTAGWVTALYQRILNRAPEQGAVPFWQQQLAGGVSENQVALDFFTSPEAYGDDVTGWFQEYLGRAPTSTEQAGYVKQMLAGATDRTIEQTITNLPEYANAPPVSPAGTGVRLPNYLPAANTAKVQASLSATDAVFGQLA